MNEIEFKFFFTFLLTFIFFIYWTSWNEETNFALIKAITINKNFYLENYRNITGDMLCYNQHCFAFSPRWWIAILDTPIYILLNFFINDENLIKFLLSLLTNNLFFSLSIPLIYKLSHNFLKKENQKILITMLYGFSTLAFQQARFFTTHSVETFFALLSIYIFFKICESNKNVVNSTILCGIFITFGSLSTPFLGLLSIFLFFIFIVKRKVTEAIIFLTVVLSIYFFPRAIYLPIATGGEEIYYSKNLVDLNQSYFLVDKPVKLFIIPQIEKFETIILSKFLQLLLFPSKGLLFYYPIFLFSFIGFFLIRNFKIEALSFLILIISSFLIISFIKTEEKTPWWFGWVSYGPARVLTVLMPFFFIGLMGFVDKFGFKITIPFFLISILNNFLLLQYGEDKISTLPLEEYKYKMEHFQALSNPIFDHYLPLTLINGPRSILLENLLIDKKISIDFKHPYNPATPEFIPPGSPIMKRFEIYLFSLPKIGIVTLRLPWLSLFIVIVILILIWKKEVQSKIKVKDWILALTLILAFLLFFIRINNFTYGDNWCAPQWYENEKMMSNDRWIGESATLILFGRGGEYKNLKFFVESFEKVELEVYLNDEKLGNYTIKGVNSVLQPLKLKENINEIRFITKGNCTKPWSVGVHCDINCISLKISNISFT